MAFSSIGEPYFLLFLKILFFSRISGLYAEIANKINGGVMN